MYEYAQVDTNMEQYLKQFQFHEKNKLNFDFCRRALYDVSILLSLMVTCALQILPPPSLHFGEDLLSARL